MPHKLAQKQFEASKQTKEWTTSYWCCSISRLKLKVHETNLHENLKILNHSITESYFLLITGLHLYVYIIVGKALLQCTGGNKIRKCVKNLTYVSILSARVLSRLQDLGNSASWAQVRLIKVKITLFFIIMHTLSFYSQWIKSKSIENQYVQMIVHYCCNELINHNSITHPYEPQLIKLKPEILNISNSGLFFILPIKVLNIRYSENRDQNKYDDRKGISHETQNRQTN